MSQDTLLAGVMGWPVKHSLSPALHGYWLKEYGIKGAYVPMAVEPDNLAAALHALPKLGFRGCNLTIPHKEAALDIVDRVDALAGRIGAINTVVVEDDGKLVGYNTDHLGFTENLKQSVPEWQPANGPAVVMGAGGAARAIVVGLIELGVPEIRVVNRTEERAKILAEGLADSNTRIRVWPWEFLGEAMEGAAVLINTTSLGMTGGLPLVIDLEALPQTAVVADIVYAPRMTDLLIQANRRGHPIVEGIGMLLHQAAPGFEEWFGKKPEVTNELMEYILSQAA